MTLNPELALKALEQYSELGVAAEQVVRDVNNEKQAARKCASLSLQLLESTGFVGNAGSKAAAADLLQTHDGAIRLLNGVLQQVGNAKQAAAAEPPVQGRPATTQQPAAGGKSAAFNDADREWLEDLGVLDQAEALRR